MIRVIATRPNAPGKCAKFVVNAPFPCVARLHANRKGSIEGLPLYFLVSALFVAVATSALLSMMGGLQGQTLGRIELTPETASVRNGQGAVAFTVTVFDTDGNPIEGAVVSVQGLGASGAQKSAVGGAARFSVQVDLGSAAFGELDIEVSHHGPSGETHRGATLLVTRA